MHLDSLAVCLADQILQRIESFRRNIVLDPAFQGIPVQALSVAAHLRDNRVHVAAFHSRDELVN
jgi:hypothetical protein